MNDRKTREKAAQIQIRIEECLKQQQYDIETRAEEAGYSRRQADRIFHDVFSMTLAQYVRARILSNGAAMLRDQSVRILDISMQCGFSSQESFSRSFFSHFGVRPSVYRIDKTALAVFLPAKASDYDLFYRERKDLYMSRKNIDRILLYPLVLPASRWIILPSEKADDYLSFCEEKGCGWEALLNSIPEKMCTACLIELPASLSEKGRDLTAAGVQVPDDYSKQLPEGYEYLELPSVHLLCARSGPYDNPDDFPDQTQCLFEAVQEFNPQEIGYHWMPQKKPVFNFGAAPEKGACIFCGIQPVKNL